MERNRKIESLSLTSDLILFYIFLQAILGDNRKLSASNDSLSDKANSKVSPCRHFASWKISISYKTTITKACNVCCQEKGGMFSGMFRKPPKPPGGTGQVCFCFWSLLSISYTVWSIRMLNVISFNRTPWLETTTSLPAMIVSLRIPPIKWVRVSMLIALC